MIFVYYFQYHFWCFLIYLFIPTHFGILVPGQWDFLIVQKCLYRKKQITTRPVISTKRSQKYAPNFERTKKNSVWIRKFLNFTEVFNETKHEYNFSWEKYRFRATHPPHITFIIFKELWWGEHNNFCVLTNSKKIDISEHCVFFAVKNSRRMMISLEIFHIWKEAVHKLVALDILFIFYSLLN